MSKKPPQPSTRGLGRLCVGHPREVDKVEILNAIFYVLCEGCRWRALL
ncbi:MAG: transposase [Rhizonema sp. NSF051]|nr:transposase [Rhizonema sp. NSF051]